MNFSGFLEEFGCLLGFGYGLKEGIKTPESRLKVSLFQGFGGAIW